MMREIILSFIPLFVAVDAIGTLPIFVGLTGSLKKQQKRKIVGQSLITALCMALGFIFLGKAVFRMLGITMSDFMIAGGIILFCIAVMDLLVPGKKRRMPEDGVGVVPIGTPLIVGPAVLTTSLILIDQFGIMITAISVLLNLLVVGVVLYEADLLLRLIGKAGSQALSKIMALLLAAIAIMMIRKGMIILLTGMTLS